MAKFLMKDKHFGRLFKNEYQNTIQYYLYFPKKKIIYKVGRIALHFSIAVWIFMLCGGELEKGYSDGTGKII